MPSREFGPVPIGTITGTICTVRGSQSTNLNDKNHLRAENIFDLCKGAEP